MISKCFSVSFRPNRLFSPSKNKCFKNWMVWSDKGWMNWLKHLLSWIFVSHNVVNEIRFENFSIDFNQLLKLVRSSDKLIWRDWAKPIKIKKSQNKSCIRRFKNNRLSSLLKLLPKINIIFIPIKWTSYNLLQIT